MVLLGAHEAFYGTHPPSPRIHGPSLVGAFGDLFMHTAFRIAPPVWLEVGRR